MISEEEYSLDSNVYDLDYENFEVSYALRSDVYSLSAAVCSNCGEWANHFETQERREGVTFFKFTIDYPLEILFDLSQIHLKMIDFKASDSEAYLSVHDSNWDSAPYELHCSAWSEENASFGAFETEIILSDSDNPETQTSINPVCLYEACSSQKAYDLQDSGNDNFNDSSQAKYLYKPRQDVRIDAETYFVGDSVLQIDLAPLYTYCSQ